MIKRLILLALCIAASIATPPARADDDDSESARAAVQRGEIRPLGELRATLRARFPGDIIEMELDHDDGRFLYEFKVLQADGRLLDIEMDAATGRILTVDDD